MLNNILNVFYANIIVLVLGFFNGLVFPKILSVEDYATYHTFLLYLNYIAVFHLGLPNGMAIKYAGTSFDDINKKEYKAETILLFLFLGSFSVLFSIAYAFTKIKMIAYLSFAIFPIVYYGSIKSLWIAWGQFEKYRNINSFLIIIIPVIAFIFFLVTGKLTSDTYITIYLLAYWIITIYLIFNYLKFTINEKSDAIFSKHNIKLLKIGFLFLVGGYINVLFTSSDKQFVQLFFSKEQFAYYSFGMSIQSMISILIVSISQPLFPKLAKGGMCLSEYNFLKNILIVLGAFLSSAYFFASFFVKILLPKYIPSLDVISIYFMVFPAIAIVNCLYLNLYKILKITSIYIYTLITMLLLSIGLNYIFILVYPNYLVVATSTTLLYYIWCFLGCYQISVIKFYKKDYLFIVSFLIIFQISQCVRYDLLAFFIFIFALFFITFMFYKKDLFLVIDKFIVNRRGDNNV